MNINEIEANLQLVGTRVSKLNIENDFVFFNPLDESVIKEIDVSYETSEPYYMEDAPDSVAENLMMFIRLNISNGTNTLHLELDIEGGFMLDCENEEMIKEMLPVNGVAAIYSIARGIVSSITSHICTKGTVLLPMINVIRLRK